MHSADRVDDEPRGEARPPVVAVYDLDAGDRVDRD
jgi:hypothetical protein